MATWDERYRRGENVDRDPLPFFVRAVGELEPGQALDLACGVGRHSLHLAARGWNVTAVDDSRVAIDMLERRASEQGLAIDPRVANLELGEFEIASQAYDLVCVTCYLQRDLFPGIRSGVRPGGTVIAAISLVDETPGIKPMDPAFLLKPGELRNEFSGWEVCHYFEGREPTGEQRRAIAEIVARRRVL